MRVRFEIPALRMQCNFHVDAVPRTGEVVYLHVGENGARKQFVVRSVSWYPEPSIDRDFQAYVVLSKNRTS